jgi:copper transport protein
LLAALAAALGAALLPGTALAHATLVSSSPTPGQRLGAAPGAVDLQFSEAVDSRLSSASVQAPDGRTYTAAVAVDGKVELPLPTNVVGLYTVRWHTVSGVDGHALSGQFTFGVGVNGGAAAGSAVQSPSIAGAALAAARGLEYLGLLWAVGGLVLIWVAARRPRIDFTPTLQWPLALALVAGIGVVLGEAALASPDPARPNLVAFLTNGGPGVALGARLALEALALATSLRLRAVSAASVVGAVVALSASGHAAAVDPAAFAVGVDATHLVLGGAWVGSILALAIAWFGPQRAAVAAMIGRARPVALAGFGGSVALGLVRADQELNSWLGLLQTSYGQTLLVKAAFVLGTASVGVVMLRWRRPGVIRLEALAGLAVVAATSLLATNPLPPKPAAEAAALATASRPDPALPLPGDVTLGSDAGSVLVGLSVRPAVPGRNQLLVYLQPPAGEAAAAGLPVSIRFQEWSATMSACGPTCRSVSADLRGGETVQVDVGGRQGGTATFTVPPLPAPSGTEALLAADRQMQKLTTYQLTETLRPPQIPVVADYTYEDPDRMHLTASDGFERIIVGLAAYSRDKASAPWDFQQLPEPITPDRYNWDYGTPTSVRVTGDETIDGVPSRVLSFFERSSGLPIWFSLWVGSDDLVRKTEMMAPLHFMEDVYSGFNQPVQIQPPPPTG